MTRSRTTAVLGLGLMGGSIARDLAARGETVHAFDRDAEVLAAAIGDGIVTRALDPSLDDLASADLVVIATPVDAALTTLSRIAPHLAGRTVVTDVGSVKRPIQDLADQLGISPNFVGSHPFAGDHRSGWTASRSGLFSGVTTFICPSKTSRTEAVTNVEAFWTSIGARTRTSDAADHDRRMAWVSHLPQAVSSALAAALRTSGLHPTDLGPGGRDTTRLAGSSPEMWAAIANQNQDNIQAALTALRRALDDLDDALGANDPKALRAFFQHARDWLA